MNADLPNLGELEMAALEYVWSHGATDVKTSYRAIGVVRGITHNTVQSAFKRLWEKDLLGRHKEGHAYVYYAVVNRRELTEMMVGGLVQHLAGDRMSVALEAFVNLAERSGSDTLDALEALIAARRSEES